MKTHNHGKPINEELSETLERLQALTDGIEALIDVTDPKTHRILFANKKTRKAYGDAILGKKCYEVFGKRTKPCTNCVIKQILGSNLGKTFTSESQQSSGRWFKSTFRAIKWPKNRYVNYAVHMDITDHKRIENERKLYAERLSALDSYSCRLNAAVDVDGICRLTLEAMRKILGFECTEFLINRKGRLQTFCRLGYPEVMRVDLPLNVKGKRGGVTVRAAVERMPIVVSDVKKNEDYIPIVKEMKSELAVPVMVEDGVFGVLNVESRKPKAFDEKDVKLLQILSANAAVAISNILKREAIRKGNNSLALLLQTSAKLVHSSDPSDFLRVMVDAIRECGWNQVVLSTNVDDEQKTVKPEDIIAAGVTKKEAKSWINKISRRDWKKFSEQDYARFRISEFYFFPWYDPLVRANWAESCVSESDSPEIGVWNPKDWLCAPLTLSDGQIAGALYLADPVDGKEPTKESLAPIELFMHIAIAAIEKDLINQQLVEGEKLFRLFAENAQDIIYRIQVQPEMKFEFISSSVFKILGYTPEEFNIEAESMFNKKRPDHFSALARYLNNPETAKGPITLQWKRKDGTPVWIELKNRLVYGEDGRLLTVEGIARDITERKLLSDKLQNYAERLEEMVTERTLKLQDAQGKLLKSERLATIGELAAMVGHDLRNPLTSITGCAYYLEKHLDKNSSQKIRDMLSLIGKNIAYSNKIINDLLDYSREIVLELDEKDPQLIMQEVLSAVKIPDKIQLVNLTKKYPKMLIDIQKIKRAFINLITNAVDAMPEGGALTITSEKIEGNVVFKFSDTGYGMPNDVMNRLWSPLFTTKAKGMGFGLPICKRIVEAHGGSIHAESAAGKGTTFTITLPIEPKTEEGGERIWITQLESSLSTMTKT